MAGGCKFGRSKIADKFKSVDEEHRAEIETALTKEGTEILKKVTPRIVKVHFNEENQHCFMNTRSDPVDVP